jgi:hypothetical protein
LYATDYWTWFDSVKLHWTQRSHPLIFVVVPCGSISYFCAQNTSPLDLALKLAKFLFCNFTFFPHSVSSFALRLPAHFTLYTGKVNSYWSHCFQESKKKKKLSKGRIHIVCLKADNKLYNFISNLALGKGWHEMFEETWNRS